MEIVVDTSAIIAVIADEPERADILRLTSDMDLVAPRSVFWEVGNAFSAMLKRNRVDLKDVMKAMETFKFIPIRFLDVELEDSIMVAADLKIYAYDAYLLQCALKYKLPLMTLDKDLINYALRKGVKVIQVTA